MLIFFTLYQFYLINKKELPCLCRNSLDDLHKNWTNLVKNIREQKMTDAWANLAEFFTLASKSQQQWIVANVICAPPAVHKSTAADGMNYICCRV